MGHLIILENSVFIVLKLEKLMIKKVKNYNDVFNFQYLRENVLFLSKYKLSVPI